jgi:hypothetical protein
MMQRWRLIWAFDGIDIEGVGLVELAKGQGGTTDV